MFTEILKHKIDYWFEPNTEICDTDIEHIEKSIKDGCREGELCQTIQNEDNDDTDTARGWWKIENENLNNQLKKEIQNWINCYEKNDEHDNHSTITLKDDTYHLLKRIIEN